MNIIFDLGGVVVRWEPAALLAQTFDDPADMQSSALPFHRPCRLA